MGVMAGTLDLVQRAYMGSEIREGGGELHFEPKPVGKLEGLSFPMRFRGMPLEVGLEGDELRIAAQSEGLGQSIKVSVGDQTKEIKAGESITFTL